MTKDTNKNTTLAKKEDTSSASESLTVIIFLYSSDYNRFGFLIAYLNKYMQKGNANYSKTVTSTYDMLTRFELAMPRYHRSRRSGGIVNMKNHGGHGVRDHRLVQHAAPSGNLFSLGLDYCTSYRIKYFSFEEWVHYENQCPEATGYNT